jgi:hypothetical protein
MCIFILFLILTNFYTPANKHAIPFLSYVVSYVHIYNLFPTKIHISRVNKLLIWKFRDHGYLNLKRDISSTGFVRLNFWEHFTANIKCLLAADWAEEYA